MPDNAKNEILALLKAQDEATARGDAESVVAAGAPELVRYDLPPPLEYRGDKDGDIAGLREWFATWDGPVTTEFVNPTVLIDGDLAVPSLLRKAPSPPEASCGPGLDMARGRSPRRIWRVRSFTCEAIWNSS